MKLWLGLILLASLGYAADSPDTSGLPSANEIRTVKPHIGEDEFKHIVEAIKKEAKNGGTEIAVDLSNTDFKTIKKYVSLLQKNGYTVDFARGKGGLNSALRISWDPSLQENTAPGSRD